MEISLLDAAVKGLFNIFQFQVLLAMLAGVSIGTFTAVAPQGLGMPLVYAILFPVVIKWEPVTGIALLIGAGDECHISRKKSNRYQQTAQKFDHTGETHQGK